MVLTVGQRGELTRRHQADLREQRLEQRRAKYARERDYERMTKPAGPDRTLYGTIGRPTEVPDHVIAERERRYQLTPCDLTALLLGDPLPGFSALDRQRRADGLSGPPEPSVGRGARQSPRPDPSSRARA